MSTYYNKTGNPQPNAAGASSAIRAEFTAIDLAFDKLPTLQAPDANKVVVLNGTGTALVSTLSLNGLTLGTPTITNPTVTGGTINNTAIGATTPAAVTGTTVTASAQFSGPGTGLTGTAAGLSIGGNAATATQATSAINATNAVNAQLAVTQPAGTSTAQIATTAFVTSTAFASALPGQAGNAGKFVTTDGVSASWANVPKPEVSNAKAYYFSSF